MENKAGVNVPSETDIVSVIDQLQAVFEKLKQFTLALTPEERKRALRLRPGYDSVIALVAELAGKRGIALPGISIETMKADREVAERLAPLATAAEALAQRIRDTILEAQSESWWATTAYYTMLARLADADPLLARQLRPALEFFSNGRRRRPRERVGRNSHE